VHVDGGEIGRRMANQEYLHALHRKAKRTSSKTRHQTDCNDTATSACLRRRRELTGTTAFNANGTKSDDDIFHAARPNFGTHGTLVHSSDKQAGTMNVSSKRRRQWRTQP
jgi:hypothetical protein